MPGQFESILDKLQAKLGKQTIRKASTINRPRPKREVQQIQIFNEFNRRNPRADGGSVDDYEPSEFSKKVNELMDDGYDFGEAVREAMRQGYDKGGKVRFKETNPKYNYIINYLKDTPSFYFSNLFEEKTTLNNIVATFLAILELTRLGEINLTQDLAFTDILCQKT